MIIQSDLLDYKQKQTDHLQKRKKSEFIRQGKNTSLKEKPAWEIVEKCDGNPTSKMFKMSEKSLFFS